MNLLYFYALCKLHNYMHFLASTYRVYGIKKLRIVDGSIFPSPVSGVPNSIIIAIAEKASRIILNSNDKKKMFHKEMLYG